MVELEANTGCGAQGKRADMGFVFLCCLVYFAAYLTRGSFSAALVAILSDLNVSKQQASIAVSGSFITYGAGQLISGYLGDRFSPRYIVAGGLALSALCSLLLPGIADIAVINVLWCINGFFQSLVWPSLVRMMSARLGREGYANASGSVMIAASFGTVLLYLLVPACIAIVSWRLAFYICGAFALAVSPLWFFATKQIRVVQQSRKEALQDNTAPIDEPFSAVLRRSALPVILLAILFQGALRDGVTTWTPAFLAENHGLSVRASILTSVLLPLFGMLGIALAGRMQRRCKNVLLTSTILFSITALACLMLLLPLKTGAVASACLLAAAEASICGVNLMLTAHLPARFANTGHVSLIAGLLNMFTYVGSACSVYGIAAVAENAGWSTVMMLLLLLAVGGTLLCALCIRRWDRFPKE